MVFVEVALVRGFASSIEELIESPVDEAGPQPDTAIFYSISNCQRGLASVSFGNFLIKQVTEMLAAEIPTLKHYATLSPIPGFCRWLNDTLAHAPSTLPLKFSEFERLDALKVGNWHLDKATTKKT